MINPLLHLLPTPFALRFVIVAALGMFVYSLPLHAKVPALSVAFQSASPCVTQGQFDTELDTLLSKWEGKSQAHFEVTVATSDITNVTLRVVDEGQVFVREVQVRDCALAAKVSALLIAITLDPATLAEVTDDSVIQALTKSPSSESASGNDAANSAPMSTDADTASSNDRIDENVLSERGESDAAPEDAMSSQSASAQDEKNEKSAADSTPSDDGSTTDASTGQPGVDPGTEGYRPIHGIVVGAGMSHLALPQWGAGPFLAYAGQIRRGIIVASGQFSFSPDTPVGDDADVSLRLWLLSLHSGAGIVFEGKAWRFSPIAGMGLHLFWSVTKGLQRDSRHLQPVASPWAGIFSSYSVTSKFGVSFMLTVDWLMANSQYTVVELGTVHDTGHALVEWGIGFFHFF